VLNLIRLSGEAVWIGDVRVVVVKGGKVKIGIEAPRDRLILREELLTNDQRRERGLVIHKENGSDQTVDQQ
jgi:carbon storage regulator CsrA